MKRLYVVSHIIFVHRPISYLLVPLSEYASQWYCLHICLWKSHHFHNFSSFNKHSSRITSENATLPIPMPRFVVIELVVSELWPFEAAIVGNRQTDRQTAYLSTVPNLAGQYRFLLLCPAVPPSTSLVLNSFDVTKFVRLFASTLVYGGHARKKGVARSCACILSWNVHALHAVGVQQLEFAVALLCGDEEPTDSHSTTDKIDGRRINNVNFIVITLQSPVQFVCPYFLHKILNFWKHSPSFFYWEVDRYETDRHDEYCNPTHVWGLITETLRKLENGEWWRN